MNRDRTAVELQPGEREADLRVSDREREQVADRLSAHAAEGRLTLEELDARVDGAYAARTRAELAALTRDLPAAAGGERPDARASRVGRRSMPALSGPVAVFVAVNLVLVAVWALSGAGYFWPIWSILGWGVALVKPGACGGRRASGHERSGLTRAGSGGA